MPARTSSGMQAGLPAAPAPAGMVWAKGSAGKPSKAWADEEEPEEWEGGSQAPLRCGLCDSEIDDSEDYMRGGWGAGMRVEG